MKLEAFVSAVFCLALISSSQAHATPLDDVRAVKNVFELLNARAFGDTNFCFDLGIVRDESEALFDNNQRSTSSVLQDVIQKVKAVTDFGQAFCLDVDASLRSQLLTNIPKANQSLQMYLDTHR